MVRSLVAAVAGLSLVTWPASAERIARVVDGDTVVTARGEKVRLMGFDMPETRGKYRLGVCLVGDKARGRQERQARRKREIDPCGSVAKFPLVRGYAHTALCQAATANNSATRPAWARMSRPPIR